MAPVITSNFMNEKTYMNMLVNAGFQPKNSELPDKDKNDVDVAHIIAASNGYVQHATVPDFSLLTRYHA